MNSRGNRFVSDVVPAAVAALNHQIGPLKAIPHDVDRAVHALSVLLSQEIHYRFKALPDRPRAPPIPDTHSGAHPAG
ncbi:MAG TPA: hypothetical protein H9902_11080, partial [Candidatus Stackebrandtia faecavium]|nr:hypothetical protein [Candidatus Stackebrandtia faecavium]